MEWGSVADWVSGIGSMSAAISALYLAKSANKIKLRAHFGIRVHGERITLAQVKLQQVIFINVTNVGNRATVIKNFGIRTGLFKKKYGILQVDINDRSDRIPKALADGEDGTWTIDITASSNPLMFIHKHFIAKSLDAWTLRLQIHTSNGGIINVFPEKSLRQEIMNLSSPEKV